MQHCKDGKSAWPVNNSDSGHTRLNQQLKKKLKITLASPYKKYTEKEADKKQKGNCKAF